MESNIQKIKNHVFKWRDFILDILFPIECLGCKKEGSWFCEKCFSQLKFNYKQLCPLCKTTTYLGKPCSRCQEKQYLDFVWAAGDYNNPTISKAIKNLKYKFIKDIAPFLGKYLSIFYKENIYEKIDTQKFIIIPVPLHKKRLHWRGFNQAQELAQVLINNFNLASNFQDLKRIKHKKPQAKLKKIQRLSNLKNCFIWTGDNLKGYKIILIDDVITTGSTLNECAKVLKENGADEVWGLVVARG